MANKLQGCNDNVVLKHLLDLRKDVDSLTFALNQLYVSTTSFRTLVLDLPLGLGEYLARVLPVTDVLAIASVNTAFAHTFSKTISSRLKISIEKLTFVTYARLHLGAHPQVQDTFTNGIPLSLLEFPR